MKKPATELVQHDTTTTSEPSPEKELKVGQWYWINDEDGGDNKNWLGCITWIGTNFAELTGPSTKYSNSKITDRIHFNDWNKRVKSQEMNPDLHINAKIAQHQGKVTELMDEVKRLTAALGITTAGALPAPGNQSQALVAVHNTADVKAHKEALILAEKKTLPELFKKIRDEHEMMASWMKTKLIPMEAESEILQVRTGGIKDRIFVVELYAGLTEELVTIQDGEPAGNDEKIHIFQRRHYMDEECLLEYQAGGMEFKDLDAFNEWLVKSPNRDRILPFPKCVVAFRVRRSRKHREMEEPTLGEFIRILNLEKQDEYTFLYIRNGDRYYVLGTSIEFDEDLFPDMEHSLLNGGKLWVKPGHGEDVISQQEYDAKKLAYKEGEAAYKRD